MSKDDNGNDTDGEENLNEDIEIKS